MRQLCHMDLTVDNAETVRDFYQEVVGWTVEMLGDDYVMKSRDDAVAGICHKRGALADFPSEWLAYFSVPNLDESLAAVAKNGGKIVISPTGEQGYRYAVISDPSSAVCTIMEGMDSMNREMWVDLTVPNAEQVRDFYQQVIGWTSHFLSMGGDDDYVMKSEDDAVAGICHKQGANAELPSRWLIYFPVKNLDESLAVVTNRGGNIIAPPRGESGKRYAVISDPSGAVCALTEG